MNTTELLEELEREYESHLKLAKLHFNKWIETGEERHKEQELLYAGASWTTLRIIENIKTNYVR
jgi:hypothetical protein